MRMRKKLLDPVSWYKNKEEEKVPHEMREKERDGRKPLKRKRNDEVEEERGEAKKKKEEDPKSVLFCPFTIGSELAKKMREAESGLEKTTGYRMKIVEEGGEKIMDILHTSNPWKGEDCGRDKCLLCMSKEMTGKGKKQDCTKRSLVYETWCQTCYMRMRRSRRKERSECTSMLVKRQGQPMSAAWSIKKLMRSWKKTPTC